MGDDVWLIYKGGDILTVGGEEGEGRDGRDGPMYVVPEKELVVDGDPYALYLGDETHVGGDAGG